MPELLGCERFLLPKNHTIKTDSSMEVKFSAFLTSSPDGLSFSAKSVSHYITSSVLWDIMLCSLL
jgi:hypothetical protein